MEKLKEANIWVTTMPCNRDVENKEEILRRALQIASIIAPVKIAKFMVKNWSNGMTDSREVIVHECTREEHARFMGVINIIYPGLFTFNDWQPGII